MKLSKFLFQSCSNYNRNGVSRYTEGLLGSMSCNLEHRHRGFGGTNCLHFLSCICATPKRCSVSTKLHGIGYLNIHRCENLKYEVRKRQSADPTDLLADRQAHICSLCCVCGIAVTLSRHSHSQVRIQVAGII